MPSLEGTLTWAPLADHLGDVARPVADAAGRVPGALVATIDPHVADTQAFCEAYDVDPGRAVHCVVVVGRRGDVTTYAAVVVRAGDTADLHGVVCRHLGARTISFADQAVVEERSGMVRGAITPIGLPPQWHLLVDERVLALGRVVVGAGIRGAKILVDTSQLTAQPGAEVLDLVSHSTEHATQRLV